MNLREMVIGVFSERVSTFGEFKDRLETNPPKVVTIYPYEKKRRAIPNAHQWIDYGIRLEAQRERWPFRRLRLNIVPKATFKFNVDQDDPEADGKIEHQDSRLTIERYRNLVTAITYLDQLRHNFPKAKVSVITENGIMDEEALIAHRETMTLFNFAPWENAIK